MAYGDKLDGGGDDLGAGSEGAQSTGNQSTGTPSTGTPSAGTQPTGSYWPAGEDYWPGPEAGWRPGVAALADEDTLLGYDAPYDYEDGRA